jgi:hypothetical protein
MGFSTDKERMHLALLWLGLLLPPLAWTVQMAAMYTAQPWQCLHPEGISVSDSISVLAALAALAAEVTGVGFAATGTAVAFQSTVHVFTGCCALCAVPAGNYRAMDPEPSAEPMPGVSPTIAC